MSALRNQTVLKLPFPGKWFVMNGGDTAKLNHHHNNKIQRYAFDFTKIDDNGHSFIEGGSSNEHYYAFGQLITAPGNGTVVEVVDGVRDNIPGQGNYLAAAGNYIIIEHSSSEFSFLAHLKCGSIKVEAGEAVTSEQSLAECGNSGQSFAPHLHYHLQDSLLLDQYKVIYDNYDLRKAPFPLLEIEGYKANGIKVYFTNVKTKYSPLRGQVVSNS